jgi:hypothetical protein
MNIPDPLPQFDDPDADLPTKTVRLFDSVYASLPNDWGEYQPVQPLPGERIGWQVDLWEKEGDARWQITVEAVGS